MKPPHEPAEQSGWVPADDLNSATAALYAAKLGPAALRDLVAEDVELPELDQEGWANEWHHMAGTTPDVGHGVTWTPTPIRRRHPSIIDQPPPTTLWATYTPGQHRYALTADQVAQAIADLGPWSRLPRAGNPHDRAEVPDQLLHLVVRALVVANWSWWRLDVDDFDGSVKRLSPGDHHEAHIDAVAIPTARKLTAVALLSDPADFDGGQLRFDFGRRHVPPLERGSIVICPTSVVHEVTTVTRGARISAVVHAYGPPLR